MSRFGRTPKALSITVDGATDYADNSYDVPTLYGAGKDAKFCQITSLDNQDILVKLNNDSECVFTLEGNSTQVFQNGDCRITRIAFSNEASGAGDVDVQVLLSL